MKVRCRKKQAHYSSVNRDTHLLNCETKTKKCHCAVDEKLHITFWVTGNRIGFAQVSWDYAASSYLPTSFMARKDDALHTPQCCNLSPSHPGTETFFFPYNLVSMMKWITYSALVFYWKTLRLSKISSVPNSCDHLSVLEVCERISGKIVHAILHKCFNVRALYPDTFFLWSVL